MTGRTSTSAAAFLCWLALVSLPTAATAQDTGFGNPSLDQYVESVPTAGGPSGAGGGQADSGEDLPPAVQRGLRERRDEASELLERIATSPALGAPKSADGAARGDGAPSARSNPSRDGIRPRRLPSADEGGFATAASAAARNSTNWTVLAGMLVIAAVVAAAGIAKRRRSGAQR